MTIVQTLALGLLLSILVMVLIWHFRENLYLTLSATVIIGLLIGFATAYLISPYLSTINN